jgi:hypothetical protein
MKARTRFTLLCTFGLLVALLVTNPTGAAPQPQPVGQAETAAAVAWPVVIRINEVMPIPAPGGHDWVELLHVRAPYTLYLPSAGQHAASQTAPQFPASSFQSLASSPISGWQLGDGDGNFYTIPAALPPVPVGARVLVHFDGLGPGADDYDLSDGVAVLHTGLGLVNILENNTDQVKLYTGSTHNSQTIRSFMAYGGPPGLAGSDAIAAGLWPPDGYVGPIGQIPGADALQAAGSLGVYPGQGANTPDGWVIYAPAQITPGQFNVPPVPYFRNPPDGITTSDHQIPIGWSNVKGAIGYRLEADDSPAFGSPLFAVEVTASNYTPANPFPDGTFYLRVKARLAGGRESGWSAANQVTFFTPIASAGTQAQVVLGITPQLQHKDSRMLCLDGHDETGQHRWDSAHETDGDWNVGDAAAVRGEPHDDMYCTRAAISMIVDYFGGHLSQDRISYFHFGGGAPDGDLGHGDGLWPCESGSWGSGDCVFGWALNGTAPTSSRGKPSFAQARAWIDANRPILMVENGDSHSVVMDGYNTNGNQAHRVDPWTGSASWISYATWNITEYHVPPAGASVRSDEAGVANDADGDGIVDYDEIVRFHTDATLADSDEDWVQDKKDVREYVFTNAGVYSLRNADMDGDGRRKELDADNDADGSVDGCEDTNYNGKYEAALGETDNFNAASHQTCVPQFEILEPTQSTPVNAGAYNNPDKIMVQVKTATPPSSPVTYTPADFSVQIGGRPSAVLAAYRVFDTHFLVVQAATQTAADYYNLRVQLGTQSDTETRAVFYLPRLRADQVLVMDRSGSMSDYDKLDAAKNAARAFIDHANIGDMIGVVSFASSAGPAADYPLTTIAGNVQWDAAKAAVNGLVAGGMTALGQGALLGYNEIVARGQADHDWAMALLSDGMENVSPYWADPAVSGVIVPSRVIVHTVALGYDADLTLMAAIAAQTGGTFYQAGTDLLPLAAQTSEVLASPAAPPGPNVPSALPNRLADIYKAMGEEIGHQQRLWERTGLVNGRLTFEVPVEKGLPAAIFAVNWADPSSPITMNLTDPAGNPISPTGPGVIFRNDPTHQQYRIANPPDGDWVVELVAREKTANYLFILSGWSRTTMHLGFGLRARDRIIGAEIPVLVFLADTKPILGAEVHAFIQGPNSDLVAPLQLFDDGAHADGRPDDGVYGNLFTRTYAAGPYFVKATGWGTNNNGNEFVRHRTGSFRILPSAGYIWRSDLPTADDYRQLLENNGFHVELIHVNDVPTINWSRYSLALIGPDTGSGSEWGTSAALATLRQYQVPILGLGEGGYAFFGKLGLAIGYPNGRSIIENRTYAMDTTHQIWLSPYPIPVSPRSRIVTLYKSTDEVGIYVRQPTADIVLLGREPNDQTHYNLIQQTTRYLLWGFGEGPVEMIEDGWHLFVNVARYLAGM